MTVAATPWVTRGYELHSKACTSETYSMRFGYSPLTTTCVIDVYAGQESWLEWECTDFQGDSSLPVQLQQWQPTTTTTKKKKTDITTWTELTMQWTKRPNNPDEVY